MAALVILETCDLHWMLGGVMSGGVMSGGVMSGGVMPVRTGRKVVSVGHTHPVMIRMVS